MALRAATSVSRSPLSRYKDDEAAGLGKAVRGLVHRQPFEDVLKDPALGGGEGAMRSGQAAIAAGLLRHREADVVGARRNFGVKREPAQLRNREGQGGGDIGRRVQDGQLLGLQALRVARSLVQPGGHAAAQA